VQTDQFFCTLTVKRGRCYACHKEDIIRQSFVPPPLTSPRAFSAVLNSATAPSRCLPCSWYSHIRRPIFDKGITSTSRINVRLQHLLVALCFTHPIRQHSWLYARPAIGGDLLVEARIGVRIDEGNEEK